MNYDDGNKRVKLNRCYFREDYNRTPKLLREIQFTKSRSEPSFVHELFNTENDNEGLRCRHEHT